MTYLNLACVHIAIWAIETMAVQVGRIRDALKPWKFERLYSGFAKIESDAAGAVKRSADRYIAIVSGTWKRKYF